ncbi:hypothetical protein [Desulfomarina profundi]|nr:hypothetical protein [Desulfomarina profundi]
MASGDGMGKKLVALRRVKESEGFHITANNSAHLGPQDQAGERQKDAG